MADDATEPEETTDPAEIAGVDAGATVEGTTVAETDAAAGKASGGAEKADQVTTKKPAPVTAKKSPAPGAAKTPGSGPEKPAGPTVKKRVTSKRVTPKGGATGAQLGSVPARAKAADDDDAGYSARYTPPAAKYAQGPSPTWVPVLMFALLGLGCLLIVANYARLFGEPQNWRLLLGLGGILGGIITATNYR